MVARAPHRGAPNRIQNVRLSSICLLSEMRSPQDAKDIGSDEVDRTFLIIKVCLRSAID